MRQTDAESGLMCEHCIVKVWASEIKHQCGGADKRRALTRRSDMFHHVPFRKSLKLMTGVFPRSFESP